MSNEIYVVAILTPKVEKLEAVEALCREHISTVQEKEPDVLTYQLHKEVPVHEGDAISLIFYDKYKDERTLHSHSMTDHYKEFAAKLTEGGLLSEPPVFKASRPIGGFANR